MAEEMTSIFEDTDVVDSEGTYRKRKVMGEGALSSPKEEVEGGKAMAALSGEKAQKMVRAEASITAEDVERLIDEAQSRALATARGDPEWRSEEPAEMEFVENKGSATQALGSQVFHQEMHGLVKSFLTKACKDLRVGSLGQFVVDALNMLEADLTSSVKCCRPGSKAGRLELFPIPVPTLHSQAGHVDLFLRAVVGSLNSLHSPGQGSQAPVTTVADVVTKRLREVLEHSPILDEVLPNISFEEFFSKKGVDYCGEEIRLAQPIVWESVEASLPAEVGTLDIRDFCTGGVLHFINHIESTLIPLEDQKLGKAPSVMVKEDGWETIARGLVARGLCQIVAEDELYSVNGIPLLNGLFSVAKDEVRDGIPVTRLIMNLKPWNAISRSLCADVGTLPAITQMGAIHIHDDDILVTSSEDLRCFFYLFGVPQAWVKFMGFGKQLPRSMVPVGEGHKRWFLAGRVLPMGYLNSVGIAQHIHRAVVQRALGSVKGLGSSIQEIRRDRSFTTFPNLFRIYLDNFDQLQLVDKRTAGLIEGTPSEMVQHLREQYAQCLLPRHPKKSVEQAFKAEVQGAWLDGENGTLCAKPPKVAKYVALALELLGRGTASQRELQVVGGGFVYIAMFKRPLLASLNQIWRMIVESEGTAPWTRKWPRREVMVELVRFVGLCPLAFMDFRQPFDAMVTASDASTTGGGICHSRGLTPYGLAASRSWIRGDIPEEQEFTQLLSIGLFDGIAALRVALDVLKAPVAGHISIEKDSAAQRVVEANFPDSELVDGVEKVTEEMVHGWALRFSNVGLVVIGSGPPCQGVSGLNADRKGALKDKRSKLFKHVPRISSLVKKHFPWAQVHQLTENVASMDAEDCETLNKEFELYPWFIDAAGISLAHRPRLYWVTWELLEGEGVEILWSSSGQLPIQGQVNLMAKVEEKSFLEKGWCKSTEKALPTFTTARPSSTPLRRPAGLKNCNDLEKQRWREDRHRFPPYQYMDCHCLVDAEGRFRPPNAWEREVILGFPPNYTLQCLKKGDQGTISHEDCRLTLLGNSWAVGVIAWLLGQLLQQLRVIEPIRLSTIVDSLTPGRAQQLQSLLQRPPLGQGTPTFSPSTQLVSKLCGLVSLKGEDLLLQASSEVPVRHHRLRMGIPSSLWRWRTVAGWKWTGDLEHINVLEARAVLTTVKWRVCQKKQLSVRCVHLVDSLVVLHALTRGRSSSRKMRSTMMRISAYLLAAGLQPLWGYVNTKDNPADRPSRWGIKKKWLKR